jgi:hypothetical protein
MPDKNYFEAKQPSGWTTKKRAEEMTCRKVEQGVTIIAFTEYFAGGALNKRFQEKYMLTQQP